MDDTTSCAAQKLEDRMRFRVEVQTKTHKRLFVNYFPSRYKARVYAKAFGKDAVDVTITQVYGDEDIAKDTAINHLYGGNACVCVQSEDIPR